MGWSVVEINLLYSLSTHALELKCEAHAYDVIYVLVHKSMMYYYLSLLVFIRISLVYMLICTPSRMNLAIG